MDFELSDDQQALRDAARSLLDSRADPVAVRAAMAAEDPYDAGLWSAMVDQGWPGIAVPEALGGVGLGVVELAVLLEQTGAHVAPTPFLQQALALDALAGAAERGVGDATWLAPLIEGNAVATVAWRPVEATEANGAWWVSGRTEPVIFGPSADSAMVVAHDGTGEAHVFALDLRERRPSAEPAMDLTRQVGWLDLDGVPAVRLGGGDAVTRFANLGALGHSAELLGAADRALAMSVEYAKDRVQFGRPIGSFQAVKHRCADMLVDVEGMRSTVYYAAWCLGADDPDASVAAATAKTWCSDAGKRVMASALQVHGGIGFTWEHDLHLFLKRAQLDQVSFGDAVYHRSHLGELLRARVEAGERVI
jgi:alkylation response protein AidB-like acyl-CoA dehydrogenase